MCSLTNRPGLMSLFVSFLFCVSSISAQQLRINELLVSNSTNKTDEDGEYNGWVEIYNHSSFPVQLENYALTNDANNPLMWRLPAVTLATCEYLLVFTSGKGRSEKGHELHTSFKLNENGEYLSISNASGAAIDSIVFGPQKPNISYGRSPDSTDLFEFFATPTPLSENILSPPTESLPLVINEILASNHTVAADEDGSFSDWIELHNTGSESINLKGFSLTDDPGLPQQWTFPDATIDAGAFLLVRASRKDRIGSELHTNFSLGSSGEYLGFYDDSGAVIDSLTFGPQKPDISFGRSPEATNSFEFFAQPSPGTANFSSPLPPAPELVINEILASNSAVHDDEDGDFSDWIEIYNPGAVSVQLQGFTLTDNNGMPGQWVFPEVSIEAGGFLLVYASGKDRSGSELHTNFKLSATGEYVGIYNGDGHFIDGFKFDAQTANISLGRLPDGNGTFERFASPTPNRPNQRSTVDPDAILFSHDEGIYPDPIALVFENSKNVGEIRYTRDGSEPSRSSDVYSEPVQLTKNTVIRAQIFIDQAAQQPIFTRTYLIDETPHLPVLSLATDPDNFFDSSTGIYVNPSERGIEWERPAFVTLIEDGETKFSVPSGVRIHGNHTRKFGKLSMRLYFRSEYGASKLKYQVFEDKDLKSFDRLVLHSGGSDQPSAHDHWTLIRDALAVWIWQERDGIISHFRPVSMYINGKYWGIYWIRERIDERYLESTYGIQDADLQSIRVGRGPVPKVIVGDDVFWNETWEFFNNEDLSKDRNYELAKNKYLGLENFTEYQIMEIFINNADWPQNNVYRFRDREKDGRWRNILWDTDSGFQLLYGTTYSHNTLEWASRGRVRTDLHYRDHDSWVWAAKILHAMLDNKEYQRFFINRFADFLNTIFLRDQVEQKVEALVGRIEAEIPRAVKRWDSEVEIWQTNLDRLRKFVKRRPEKVYSHIRGRFNLDTEIDLTIEPAEGDGRVKVNSVSPASYPWTGYYFEDVPITLQALPEPGATFIRWSDPDLPKSEIVEIDLSESSAIHAVFSKNSSVPLVISNSAVASISDTCVTIAWETSKPTMGRVAYGTTKEYGKVTAMETVFKRMHSQKLTGLKSDQVYHFNIVAQTAENESVIYEDQSFKTRSEPAFSIRINGGGAAFITPDQRYFVADQPYSPGSFGYVGADAGIDTTTMEILETENDKLYQSGQLGLSAYKISVPHSGTYAVTFHFAEILFQEEEKRVFNISIEDVEVLQTLDLHKHSGYNVASTFNFETVVNDEVLDIDFTSITGKPLLNGVEVLLKSISDSLATGVRNTGSPEPDANLYPNALTISPNYPNPFNIETSFEIRLAESGSVHLAVYSIDGRETALLHDGPLLAGKTTIRWNGLGQNKKVVSSGVYIVRARLQRNNGNTIIRTQRITLLK